MPNSQIFSPLPFPPTPFSPWPVFAKRVSAWKLKGGGDSTTEGGPPEKGEWFWNLQGGSSPLSMSPPYAHVCFEYSFLGENIYLLVVVGVSAVIVVVEV